MKGLWIKDWRLFLQQKKFLVVVACILVVFALSTLNLSFALSYGVFMLTYVAVGTISYDDTGKGLSYIFTWPISRRQYVTEKYLFTSAVALGSWLVLVLAGGVIQKIQGITGRAGGVAPPSCHDFMDTAYLCVRYIANPV